MVLGHGDLRRAGHGNHTKPSVTKLAHPPEVWAVTVMTPSHCAFVWPVLQLLWIPRPIEWEGFPPQRPSQQTNTPDKQVPTASKSKQLPTVTVWLVLVSHKEVLHEALLSLSLLSFTAKFPDLRVRAPSICPQKKKGIHNQKGRIIINHNSMKCALRYYAFIGSYLICAQETLLESVNFS